MSMNRIMCLNRRTSEWQVIGVEVFSSFVKFLLTQFPLPRFSLFSFLFPSSTDLHENFYYERSSRGNPILVLSCNRYVRNRESTKRVFWRCTKYYQTAVRCPGSLAVTKNTNPSVLCVSMTRQHNHVCETIREQAELKAIKNKKQ